MSPKELSLAEHLSRIGSIKSPAKAKASRENGLKGGRPKNTKNKGKNTTKNN